MEHLFPRKKESYIGMGFLAVTIIWTMFLVHLVVKAVAFVFSFISSLL